MTNLPKIRTLKFVGIRMPTAGASNERHHMRMRMMMMMMISNRACLAELNVCVVLVWLCISEAMLFPLAVVVSCVGGEWVMEVREVVVVVVSGRCYRWSRRWRWWKRWFDTWYVLYNNSGTKLTCFASTRPV